MQNSYTYFPPKKTRKWWWPDEGSSARGRRFALRGRTRHDFPVIQSSRPALHGAVLAVLLALFTGGARGQLSTALQVRSLNFAEAESGRAVDLTGVVIFADPPGTVFVQDATAGTFFRLEGAVPPNRATRSGCAGCPFRGFTCRESNRRISRSCGIGDYRSPCLRISMT